jgi:hypothetical protein
MSPPSHATLAGARYLALRKLGQTTGRSTLELLQLYALEGFLSRLTRSQHRNKFVLKGGMLLAAMRARRPTRDVDLLALQTPNDGEAIRTLVVEIMSEVEEDGLIFDPESTDVETIREADTYPGVRVTLRVALATARLVFHVDINVGDPLWPDAEDIRLPRLLTPDTISLRGYPVTMVLAEKIVTAMQRGTANTRWRDFADILLLVDLHPISGGDLERCIQEVARFRQTPLVPLAQTLQGFEAESHWRGWRRRQQLEERLPDSFAEVLARITKFADPVICGKVEGAMWGVGGWNRAST